MGGSRQSDLYAYLFPLVHGVRRSYDMRGSIGPNFALRLES